MSHYENNPKDLPQDTKQFLNSDYGKYMVETLEGLRDGALVGVSNIKVEHPERYAARYGAFKEVLEFIRQPLDDDTSTQG